MNPYIWQDTEPVSRNYYRDGSVAVVAADLHHARHQLTLAAKVGGWDRDDWGNPGAPPSWLAQPPTRTYRLDASTDEFDVDPDDVYPPEVLTFPNAGCC